MEEASPPKRPRGTPSSSTHPSQLQLERFIDSLKFDFFLVITDETGMLQHSTFSIPDRRLGYTTDDNARALIVSTRQYNLKTQKRWLMLANRFLAFLVGMQTPDGRFHNFMTYTREVREDFDSGDHLGRSLWAAGCTIDSNLPNGVRASAKEIFDKALPWALRSKSPRVRAHAIKGLSRYINSFGEDSNARRNLSYLVNQLAAEYKANRSNEWGWFEDTLTYENWRLPESLFEAYLIGEDCLEIAEESLNFLISVEFKNDMLVPVGCQGWYPRNRVKAEFDQLPVEAGSAAETLAIASTATGSSHYWSLALSALEWYHGKNLRDVALYDEKTGACHDGISTTGLNLNKGAESTLSYLLAVTRLRAIARSSQ